MRRSVLLFALFSVLLTACGGGAAESTTATETTTATAGSVDDDSATGEAPADDPGTTGQPDETVGGDEPSAEPRVTDFDGPLAADFSIDLNKTGMFTLSEEARPVYLVFWAEW